MLGPASAARVTCPSSTRPTSTPAHSAAKSVTILISTTAASGPATGRPFNSITPTAAMHGRTTTRSRMNTG